MVAGHDTHSVFVEVLLVAVVIQVLLRLERRHPQPALNAGDEFTIHHDIEPCGVSRAVVGGVVALADILNLVGDEVVQILVVQFTHDLERTPFGFELVVDACHSMDGALRRHIVLHKAVQPAHFTVERRLVVVASRKAVRCQRPV